VLADRGCTADRAIGLAVGLGKTAGDSPGEGDGGNEWPMCGELEDLLDDRIDWPRPDTMPANCRWISLLSQELIAALGVNNSQ